MSPMTLPEAMKMWEDAENITLTYLSDKAVSITTNVFDKTVHEQVDAELTTKFNDFFDHPRGLLVTKAENSFRCYFYSPTNEHLLHLIVFFYNEEKRSLVRRHRDRSLLSSKIIPDEDDLSFIRQVDKHGGELLLEEKPFRMLHVTGSIQHQHLAV